MTRLVRIKQAVADYSDSGDTIVCATSDLAALIALADAEIATENGHDKECPCEKCQASQMSVYNTLAKLMEQV